MISVDRLFHSPLYRVRVVSVMPHPPTPTYCTNCYMRRAYNPLPPHPTVLIFTLLFVGGLTGFVDKLVNRFHITKVWFCVFCWIELCKYLINNYCIYFVGSTHYSACQWSRGGGGGVSSSSDRGDCLDGWPCRLRGGEGYAVLTSISTLHLQLIRRTRHFFINVKVI